MADIAPTDGVLGTGFDAGNNVQHTIWETLTETNTNGTEVSHAGHSDRSVQVQGTFGGTTITIQGSNVKAPAVAADWFTLHDTNGDALTFTVAGGEIISENTVWVRPIAAGGTSVDIDVIIASRRVG